MGPLEHEAVVGVGVVGRVDVRGRFGCDWGGSCGLRIGR